MNLYLKFVNFFDLDVILDPLLSLRKDLKGMDSELQIVLILDPWEFLNQANHFFLWVSLIAERHNVKVSVNDIVIKAVAVALRNVPEANGNGTWTCDTFSFQFVLNFVLVEHAYQSFSFCGLSFSFFFPNFVFFEVHNITRNFDTYSGISILGASHFHFYQV